MYYLGIDSGGTKAAFLLTDKEGTVYARYRGAGCAVLGARKEGVRQRVEEGLEQVCAAAGIRKDEIAALGLGISGYGEGAGTEQETRDACDEAFFPGRSVCSLDTYVGWAGSLLFEPGVNIIAGTGAVVFGVNADGKTARANGWGAGCDEGSCSWHGQRTVEAYTKQADGRMKRTPLYQMFRDRYHIKGEDDQSILPLNREIVRGGRGLAEIQYLLRDACAVGDETARDIYRSGAQELYLGVCAVAEELGFADKGLKVSYSGGLFKSGECALSPLRALIEGAGWRLIAPKFEPDVGAVLMAIRFDDPDYDVSRFCLRERKGSANDGNDA